MKYEAIKQTIDIKKKNARSQTQLTVSTESAMKAGPRQLMVS